MSPGKRSIVTDAWLLEALAVAGSILALVVMVVLLAQYDNHPIFDWHGVTLNAIVSLLATVSKAWLMLAIAESVSQWKWILFSQRHRLLSDFDTIDSASRGPLGSIKLLWRAKGATIVCIGAVVTVLTIAVDPFAQQLIQFDSRLSPETGRVSTIARAQRYSKGNLFVSSGPVSSNSTHGDTVHTDADFAMQSAILFGLVEPLEMSRGQAYYDCPTADCEWTPFESLAVCSVCNDVAASLRRSEVTGKGLFTALEENNVVRDDMESISGSLTRLTLPNGLYIDNFDAWQLGHDSPVPGVALMTTFSTGNASTTLRLQYLDTLIWAVDILRVLPNPSNDSAAWPDLPVEATECALYYCVNRYSSRMSDGAFEEEITPVFDASRSPYSWQLNLENGTSVELNASGLSSLEYNRSLPGFKRTDLMLGNNFSISHVAVKSISAHFQSLLSTELRSDVHPMNGFVIEDVNTQYEPSAMQALFDSSDLNETFQSLAASMSNAIRAGDDDGLMVEGTANVVVTFYAIRWVWITLPCILVLAGLAYLVLTILETKKSGVQVWKSSSIAVLARGPYIAEVLDGISLVSEMDEKAKKESVQLFEKESPAVHGSQIPLKSLTALYDARASDHSSPETGSSMTDIAPYSNPV